MCRRQLLVQNLGQLGQFLPSQIRRHQHEALGDRVDRRRDAHRVRTLQVHPQEVARGIGRDLELLTERARGVAHRRHRELDGATGGDRASGRRPDKAQAGADGIPRGAVLDLDALVRRQREGLSASVQRETIHPWSILLRHPECLEHRGVLARPGRHEQALVPHHLVEHAVRLQEIEPCFGLERLPRANRATLLPAALIRLVDPQRRLHHVLRLDEPRRRQAADRAHDGHHRNQPFEARDGAQHTAPVDAGFRLGESLAESQVSGHGRRSRGRHGRHRRTGVKG